MSNAQLHSTEKERESMCIEITVEKRREQKKRTRKEKQNKHTHSHTKHFGPKRETKSKWDFINLKLYVHTFMREKDKVSVVHIWKIVRAAAANVASIFTHHLSLAMWKQN